MGLVEYVFDNNNLDLTNEKNFIFYIGYDGVGAC